MTTILLVDDSDLVRGRLGRLLGLIPGVEVAGETGDPQDTIRLVRELRPDILVLDLLMPGMNGLDVLRGIRRDALKVATFVYSSYLDEYIRATCLVQGASAVFEKSTQFGSLVAAIREKAAAKAVETETRDVSESQR